MPVARSGSVMEALATAAAACAVGFTSSFHCFAMCGPLACASLPGKGRSAGALLGYHGARLASYTLVGGLLGSVGAGVGRVLSLQLAAVAPWLLVATLLATALDLGRRVPALPWLAQIVRSLARAAQNLAPAARAATLGGLTPLLPCGLLYGMFAASISASSFPGGALALGAFGLGAMPALLLAQLPARRLLAGDGQVSLLVRRGIPALAAVVLAYRAIFVHAAQGCH